MLVLDAGLTQEDGMTVRRLVARDNEYQHGPPCQAGPMVGPARPGQSSLWKGLGQRPR